MSRISSTSRVAPRRRVTSKSAPASRSRSSVAAKRRALRMASAAWPTSVSRSSRSPAPRRRGRADTNESTPSRRPSWMMGIAHEAREPVLLPPARRGAEKARVDEDVGHLDHRAVGGDPAHQALVERDAAHRVALVQPGIREGARLEHLLRGVGRPDPRRGAAEELRGGAHDGPEDLVEVERRGHHLVDPAQRPQPLLAHVRLPEQARILDRHRRLVRELAEHAQIRVGPDAPGPGGHAQDPGDLPAEAQRQHGLRRPDPRPR